MDAEEVFLAVWSCTFKAFLEWQPSYWFPEPIAASLEFMDKRRTFDLICKILLVLIVFLGLWMIGHKE